MEEPLERVVEILEDSGLHHTVGPLGTTIEAEDLEDILDVVRDAHDAIVGDVPRVITQITIDHRVDKEETADSLRQVRH